MLHIRRIWFGLLFLAGLLAGPALAAPAGPADRLLAQMDQATSIAQGRGNRVVWIFFDPNCPYCHRLYERLRPWVGKDNLQFRWVPVGLLTPTSGAKAAALLQARNPLAALEQNENDFNFSAEGPGGGIAPAKNIASKTRMDLQANLALLQGENINGVPLMVFRRKDGGAALFIGAPTPAQLAELLRAVK